MPLTSFRIVFLGELRNDQYDRGPGCLLEPYALALIMLGQPETVVQL